MKSFKKHIANILSLVFVIGAGTLISQITEAPTPTQEIAPAVIQTELSTEPFIGGASIQGGEWAVISSFDGYQTKADPTKITDGANPQGENTTINNGDRVSVRKLGYDVFPDGGATTTLESVHSLHSFRKRDGTNIFMKAQNDTMYWLHESSDTWEVLESGYTADKEFGFADYNINTDLVSYVYYGNAYDPFTRWSGAVATINGALSGGEATITVDDTIEFDASGTLRICGTDVTYSGKTDTSFTGASGTPACADGRGVTQHVVETAANPRGNIYMTAQNRLFISGTTSTPQAVFFSKYGDADEFTTTTLVTDTTAEDSGIFNLAEGGGGVEAMVQDEESIYFLKKSIIYKATLSDSLYTLLPLKPFDGKSQTTGAQTSRSTFAGGNGIFFITPDNQIMNLTRVDNVDYPQIIPISDIIKPTIEAGVFTSSTGIYWKDKAYIAAKQDSNSNVNDTVFVYNFRLNAWESPITGWAVADWAIYDDGTGEELFFSDASTANVYKVTGTPLDDVHGVRASWRSKPFDFGSATTQKEIDSVFIEGYITDNTKLTISLLLDEDGVTQVYQTDLAGTETDYLFDTSEYNVFGFTEFGTERFGTNDDLSGLKKFRVYLNKNFRRAPFYTAQIEFANDDENAQWEILRFGFHVRETNKEEDRALYREFN